MENKESRIGLVIMASGMSRRFGRNKLMEPLAGQPLIQWALNKTAGKFDKRVVVTRKQDVKKLCDEQNIPCIFHELPGRNDTVRLGLSALMNDIDYCFFMPADQPLISEDSLRTLVNAAKKSPDKIVRAGFQEAVGSPMGFPREYFDELLNLPEGKGGSVVAKKHSDRIQVVQVSAEYELFDIDTEEDLQKIKQFCSLTVFGNDLNGMDTAVYAEDLCK